MIDGRCVVCDSNRQFLVSLVLDVLGRENAKDEVVGKSPSYVRQYMMDNHMAALMNRIYQDTDWNDVTMNLEKVVVVS